MRSRACRSLLVVVGLAGAGGSLTALGAPAAGRYPLQTDPGPTLTLNVHALGAARRVAPGDRIERFLDLRYAGRGRLARVILVSSARRSSPLDADRLQGLRVALDRCSVPWARHARGYRCTGRHWDVVPKAPVTGSRRLTGLSLTPGRTDHLRLTLAFPARAGNGLQGQTSLLVYRLVGG